MTEFVQKLGQYRTREKKYCNICSLGELYECEKDSEKGVVHLLRKIDKSQCPFLEEINQLKEKAMRFKHDNVVALMDLIGTHENICLISEKGVYSMSQYLLSDNCRNNRLPPAQAVQYFKQILYGYVNLRETFFHGNLNLNNLIFFPGDQIKIDYFLDACKSFYYKKQLTKESNNLNNQTGLQYIYNLQYASPEVIRGEAPSEHSEVWSLGVIFFILLYGVWPFHGTNEDSFLKDIQYRLEGGQMKLPKMPRQSKQMKKFLRSILNPIKEERTLRQILKNEIIKKEQKQADPMQNLSKIGQSILLSNICSATPISTYSNMEKTQIIQTFSEQLKDIVLKYKQTTELIEPCLEILTELQQRQENQLINVSNCLYDLLVNAYRKVQILYKEWDDRFQNNVPNMATQVFDESQFEYLRYDQNYKDDHQYIRSKKDKINGKLQSLGYQQQLNNSVVINPDDRETQLQLTELVLNIKWRTLKNPILPNNICKLVTFLLKEEEFVAICNQLGENIAFQQIENYLQIKLLHKPQEVN